LLRYNEFDLWGTFDCLVADNNEEYEVKVQGVDITPYPIARGEPATFRISANTGILKFTYEAITCVYSFAFDVCNGFTGMMGFFIWVCFI